MTKQMKGLAHIGVFTEDMDHSMKFYTDTLGFTYMDRREIPKPEGTTKLGFINAGNLVIELIQPADTAGIKDRKAGIVDHVAIEVDDIDRVIQSLREKGIAFNTSEKMENPYLFHGVSNIFFQGPSGESLELFQYHPETK